MTITIAICAIVVAQPGGPEIAECRNSERFGEDAHCTAAVASALLPGNLGVGVGVPVSAAAAKP